MPIKIPNDLPAAATLQSENIFVMPETRAITQDIRPLEILILNLMPTMPCTSQPQMPRGLFGVIRQGPIAQMRQQVPASPKPQCGV